MRRIQQLDGVRALAILAVFLHHAFKAKLLWMGVDLFFVLSGFLITGVLMGIKHHPIGSFFRHFYARRARRILPPYLLVLGFATVFIGAAWLHYWYLYVLLTNFILPLNIPHPVAFDPLWSLAVEEQFYLVWPFAVYFLDERQLRRLTLLLIVIAPVLRGAVHFPTHWFVYALTPFRMDLLAAGAFLWLEWHRNRALIVLRGPPIGALLATLGIAGIVVLARLQVSTFGNSRVGNIFIYESSLCICVGLMLYALSGWKVGWLCLKPLTYVGQISYSMYLVHLGVLGFTQSHFGQLTAAVTAFAITIAYASISWALMEGPLLRRDKVESLARTSQA